MGRKEIIKETIIIEPLRTKVKPEERGGFLGSLLPKKLGEQVRLNLMDDEIGVLKATVPKGFGEMVGYQPESIYVGPIFDYQTGRKEICFSFMDPKETGVTPFDLDERRVEEALRELYEGKTSNQFENELNVLVPEIMMVVGDHIRGKD